MKYSMVTRLIWQEATTWIFKKKKIKDLIREYIETNPGV